MEVVQSGFHYSGGECDYLGEDYLLFFCVESMQHLLILQFSSITHELDVVGL